MAVFIPTRLSECRVVFPMLSDRDEQFWGLMQTLFWGAWLSVSARLIGTVVPVF